MISENSNSENNNNNQNNGPTGPRIQVHLSNQNIGSIGPLTIFIIATNEECATATVNLDPLEPVRQEAELTFEFWAGIIDVNGRFNVCVETSIDFDFICVLGTNSP